MRLAVDVLGGDNAPEALLKGCIGALPELDANDTIVLVGPRDLIEKSLSGMGVSDPRIEIEHAPDKIEMHESPTKAVRAKLNSSIVRTVICNWRRRWRISRLWSAAWACSVSSWPGIK